MLRSPTPAWVLSRNHCRKFSMPLNKAAGQLGGLGLGLAISKALVEAHKGTITAQSAGRNKGSTFTLVFPTCETAAAQDCSRLFPQKPERQGMRILLVEDHEDTNRSLTNLLRRRGYQVQSALNFQSALDLSSKEQFDVLIQRSGVARWQRHRSDAKTAIYTPGYRDCSHRFWHGG